MFGCWKTILMWLVSAKISKKNYKKIWKKKIHIIFLLWDSAPPPPLSTHLSTPLMVASALSSSTVSVEFSTRPSVKVSTSSSHGSKSLPFSISTQSPTLSCHFHNHRYEHYRPRSEPRHPWPLQSHSQVQPHPNTRHPHSPNGRLLALRHLPHPPPPSPLPHHWPRQWVVTQFQLQHQKLSCHSPTLRGSMLPHLPTHLRHSLPQLAHLVSRWWGFHFCWSWDWEWCGEIVGWLWFESRECGWPSWTHWIGNEVLKVVVAHFNIGLRFIILWIVSYFPFTKFSQLPNSFNQFIFTSAINWLDAKKENLWKKIMWIYFI